MEAYFDNSATTRCYPEVAEIVVKTMTEDFGNPSAMHLKKVWKRKSMSVKLHRHLQNSPR